MFTFRLGTVDQVLLWHLNPGFGFILVLSFDSTGARVCPTRSTLTLIIKCNHWNNTTWVLLWVKFRYNLKNPRMEDSHEKVRYCLFIAYWLGNAVHNQSLAHSFRPSCPSFNCLVSECSLVIYWWLKTVGRGRVSSMSEISPAATMHDMHFRFKCTLAEDDCGLRDPPQTVSITARYEL